MANINPKVVFEMLFDVRAQKIDGITLNIYEIVVVAFSLMN